MKNKKLFAILLLAGMLFVSVGTTAFAAGPANFGGSKSGNSYCIIISNATKDYRYSTLSLKAYDNSWKYKSTFKTGSKILTSKTGGSNANSITGSSSAPRAKGVGVIYNSQLSSSGVAASYVKEWK